MLETHFNEENKVLTCTFSGRMDGSKTTEVSNLLSQKLDEVTAFKPGLKVDFELSGVEYVASAFIRLCLDTAKELPEGDFAIVNHNPYIEKTLKLAGIDDVLHKSTLDTHGHC